MKRIALVLLVFVALGCDRKNTNTSAPSSPPTAIPSAPAQTDPALQYKDSDIPVDADFEEEADKSIDAKNYKSELDTIDKDIGAVSDGTAPTDTAD
jgi:hypothetical protein